MDELVIINISEDGSAVQVRYPSTVAESGYRTLWFPIEEVIPLAQISISKRETTDKLTTYRLNQKISEMERCGTIGSNSKYTILGTHESGYLVIMYHITETTINGCTVSNKIALIQP